MLLTMTSVVDGPYELNQITYSYDASNGFTAMASLEDTNSASDKFSGNWQKAKQNHYAPEPGSRPWL